MYFLVCIVFLLYVFMFCYGVHINTMFGSSLPPVVGRRAHILFTLFVLVDV
jgi:hypothetical protein